MENVKNMNNYQTLTNDQLKLVIGGKCSWKVAGKAVITGGIQGAARGGWTGAAIGAAGGAAGYAATCWW
ncbi:MAG: Blp family class II bacteriocin [Aerococcus sp.]|nr:Blp family class II bacteriocin [Aerococcus sp.]